MASPPFGATLRRFRLAANLTQEELAEHATISVRAISDLERGVNRAPKRETLRLLADALALAPGDRDALIAAARGQSIALPPLSPAPHLHNLPAPVTPLLGRAAELADASALIHEDGVRLLTITGPGGVGKTRFALELAASLLSDYPDGAFFVSLATVRDPDFVRAFIAQTLGLRESPDQSAADLLTASLREKRFLLVLDNFEHLLSEAMTVANLLAHAPYLTIIVTSRATLHLRGEYEVPLAPLPVPDYAQHADLGTLARSPAVALFDQRARASKRGFRLSEENATTVAAICTRLDGLPLAIELAAARIKFFAPDALLARLERRLPELTDGPRDLPARQRTMTDAIAWSYGMLGTEDQRLFRTLAVFVGGWTTDAARAVCAQEGNDNVWAALTTLIDHSLVNTIAVQGGTRLTMLETIREYGLLMLDAQQETAEGRARHAAYFLRLATEATTALAGAEQTVWLTRLEVEHDNFRTALQWLHEQGKAENGLRLAVALAEFWYTRGHLHEGRMWLERMTALAEGDPAVPAGLHAQALYWTGVLVMHQGDYAHATALHEAALDLGDRHGERQAATDALVGLGNLASRQGAYDRAIALYEQSLARCQQRGDQRGIARALAGLGSAEERHGAYARAATYYERSLAINRQFDDWRNIALSLNGLGMVAEQQSDPDRALAYYEESLAIRRALGDKRGTAICLFYRARVANHQSAFDHAATHYTESLMIFREIGDRSGMADALNGLGIIARKQGAFTRAMERYTEALALRRQIGDKPGIAALLTNIGNVAFDQGDYARARACYEESLTIRRNVGLRVGIATSLENLAHLAHRQGDIAHAERLHEESLALRTEIGDRFYIAHSLGDLGEIAYLQGDLTRATALLTESIALSHTLNDKGWSIAQPLEILGYVAQQQTRTARAVRLYGATAALWDKVGVTQPPVDRATHDAMLAAARATLGDDAFAAAWAMGYALSLEGIIAEAVEEDCSVALPDPVVTPS